MACFSRFCFSPPPDPLEEEEEQEQEEDSSSRGAGRLWTLRCRVIPKKLSLADAPGDDGTNLLYSTLNAAIMLAEKMNVSVVLVQPVKLKPKLNRYLPDVCAALLPELRKHRHLMCRDMFSMYNVCVCVCVCERERERESPVFRV